MRAKREEMFRVMMGLIDGGMARKDAYRRAYNKPGMGDVTAAKMAWKELKRRKDREKVKEMREKVELKVERGEGGEVYTKEELMLIVCRMIDEAREDGQPKVAIAAVNTLAKMAGYNEPDKIEVKDDRVEEFVKGQMERARAEGIVRRKR